MRIMLGTEPSNPSLLVSVDENFNPQEFDFHVVNGNWYGKCYQGHITVVGCPSGPFSSLDRLTILSDNQDRLRGNYRDVFDNFDDAAYVAPLDTFTRKQFDIELDDDIAF